MLITFLFALSYFIIILRINYRKETMYDINYIIKLLNIQDKNITITKLDFINNTYKILANQIRNSSKMWWQCPY